MVTRQETLTLFHKVALEEQQGGPHFLSLMCAPDDRECSDLGDGTNALFLVREEAMCWKLQVQRLVPLCSTSYRAD